jgi:hemerythrin
MSGQLVWNDGYSVNVESMDQQHMKLVGMLNTMSEAMAQQEGEDALDVIFKNLLDYVAIHFADEEALMRKYRYPEYDEHKKKHEAITREVIAMKNNNDDSHAVKSVKMLRFLTDWLTKHIMGTDKKYGKFIASVEAS